MIIFYCISKFKNIRYSDQQEKQINKDKEKKTVHIKRISLNLNNTSNVTPNINNQQTKVNNVKLVKSPEIKKVENKAVANTLPTPQTKINKQVSVVKTKKVAIETQEIKSENIVIVNTNSSMRGLHHSLKIQAGYIIEKCVGNVKIVYDVNTLLIYKIISDNSCWYNIKTTHGYYFIDQNSNIIQRSEISNLKPIDQCNVSDIFGYRICPYKRRRIREFHAAIDLSAKLGSPIYSIDTGCIIKQEYSPSYGNYMIIDHGEYMTLYAHMSRFNSKFKVNSIIHAGAEIGYLGNTGFSTGPHTHFEIRINSTSLVDFDEKDYKNVYISSNNKIYLNPQKIWCIKKKNIIITSQDIKLEIDKINKLIQRYNLNITTQQEISKTSNVLTSVQTNINVTATQTNKINN